MNWRQFAVVIAATAILFTLAWAQVSPDSQKCSAHMKKALKAVQMYLQEWDNMFPPATTAQKLSEALQPYAADKYVLTCPVTRKDYRTNPHVTWRPASMYPKLSEVVVLYDAVPHKDKRYVVGFADGSVKVVTEKELAAIKQKARLK
ncbi:MAG: hypothetical protein KatS3mg023_0957 [Armatimonadota bacterium]|nr:MAG: hypothetical protein KatS3mg023_0957 [Armatimonadota bacterium]